MHDMRRKVVFFLGALSILLASVALGNSPEADRTIALWIFNSPAGGRIVNSVQGASSLSDLVPRNIYQSVKTSNGLAYHFQDGMYATEAEELPAWLQAGKTESDNVPFTMEYWLRPTEKPAERGLLFNQAYSKQAGWSLYLNKDLRPQLRIENPAMNKSEEFITSVPLKLGQWAHLAVTYDGSHVRFYIDGKLDSEHAYSGPCIEKKGSCLVGAGAWTDCFIGDIAAIRLSSGAVTSFDTKLPTAKEAASPVIDRWYDAYRPTKTYMDLAGWWEYRGLPGARSFIWPMPENGWKPVYLPSDAPQASLEQTFGYKPKIPVDYYWFKRDFKLSKELREKLSAGERIILHLGGLGYRWQLRINGKKVAEVWDAYNSYDYDITDIIHPDGGNRIALGTSNRNGFAATDTPTAQLRAGDGDFLIAPVGRVGANNTRPIVGVWGEIELWARPTRRIEDVFVRPSFRGKRLDVDVEVTGGGNDDVQVTVLDADEKQVLDFSAKSLQSSKAVLSASWPSPHLWMPENPYMYTLQVKLLDSKTGKILDTRRIPFGFREIWIDGENFIFNGKRLFLVRTSLVAFSESDAKALVLQAKDEKANAARLHVCDFFRPGAFAHYADRMGMLIIPESPFFWNPGYKLKDIRFWTNYQNQLKPWVKNARNHPSIVMWSLSNEVLWCDAQVENPNAPILMQQTAQQVRSDDSTRPVQFDGDWDIPPFRQINVANLHYPWEPLDHWYPTECWAFQNPDPAKPLSIRGNIGTYRWKRGEKPIVVGEFACAFKTFTEAPVPMTKYVGDRAYDWNYWSSGKLWRELVRWQCDAWRVARFAGVNPWYYPQIPDHAGWAELMPLETVILRDQYTTFFSGEKANLSAFLLNDTLENHQYQVTWYISDGKKRVYEKSINAAVVGGGIIPFRMELELPKIQRSENLKLTVQCVRDSRIVYDRTSDIRVRPAEKISWPAKTVLFDPKGQTAALLAELNVNPVKIGDIDSLSQVKSVVLGRNALASMNERQISQLRTFVNNGGTVLLMGEDNWLMQAAEIGLGARMLPQSRANRAWVRSAGHPALEGIIDEDLAIWRDGDWVADCVLEKPVEPVGVAWRTLIDVGSMAGLNGAALMEVFDGKGRYLINQMDLSKAVRDPGARALLANLLKDVVRENVSRTGVSIESDGQSAISQIVAEQAISRAAWTANNFAVPLFVQAGFGGADANAISRWVHEGGRAWLFDVNPDNVARWAKVITGGIKLEPCNPQEGCLVKSQDPILWGISSEEMFWASGVWTMTCIRTSQTVQDPYGVWRLAKIASYAIAAGKNCVPLVSPATMVKISDGKGFWLISTIDFDAGKKNVGEKTYRLVQNLCANLGLSPSAGNVIEFGNYQPISLVKYVNRGFQDDQADNGRGGWTDQGESDLRFFPVNLSGLDRFRLPCPPPAEFPKKMILANVPFEILDPREHKGRACLMLEPNYKELPLVKRGDYVPAVKGVPVGRCFDRLYSLHSAGWASAPAGTPLWWYILHYSDGTTAKIPVRQDMDVADWTNPRRLVNARVGWAGDSMARSTVGLFVAGFDNPFPQKYVKMIDIVSAKAQGIPGIVALTTATKGLTGQQEK